jgi:alcohol dehydrogenase
MVLIGNVTASTVALPLGLAIVRGLEIIGSDSVSAPELDATFQFLDRKRIRPHIDRVLKLEQAASAHTLLEQRGVTGRVVLQMQPDW